jgi:hypothetical protein
VRLCLLSIHYYFYSLFLFILVTPPEDSISPHRIQLPPLQHYAEPARSPPFFDTRDAPVDWLDMKRTRSAQSIAERTCEMVCYLWFGQFAPSQSSSTTEFIRLPPSQLQMVPSSAFVEFMRKLLETTQLSQSVIVLSLHYIYKLRGLCNISGAAAGSEYRVAVAGLMMANKFLDESVFFHPGGL